LLVVEVQVEKLVVALVAAEEVVAFYLVVKLFQVEQIML
jgi:hypothetical protein